MVGYHYYLLFVKETNIQSKGQFANYSRQSTGPHALIFSRSCKLWDRMKTDGWMVLIQYLKYRTQLYRCVFRCYLKEETEYLGIVSFIHKYYKFYIIWKTILNIQGGLKEGVKADWFPRVKQRANWEAVTDKKRKREKPGQWQSQENRHQEDT